VVAQCLVTRTAGAQIGCQRPSRFWGLGCPKIYHEAEDTLDPRFVSRFTGTLYPCLKPYDGLTASSADQSM
ncbi:hypothetical protein, partial [Thiolapillus sp.]